MCVCMLVYDCSSYEGYNIINQFNKIKNKK